jgi:hypothetical protein
VGINHGGIIAVCVYVCGIPRLCALGYGINNYCKFHYNILQRSRICCVGNRPKIFKEWPKYESFRQLTAFIFI